ncbi:MAG: insulinase family protein [Bacteroidales bacterium]|jgi:zinc protease|nr:insulinase family protein [Bacteroidales bacterium]
MVRKLFLMLAAIVFTFGVVIAQDPNGTINNDPNVRIGKLDNGMTYYIRVNKKPEKRVEFRLAVNAGSNQENEDQRGLAHFTEHMAFNGIKGYPGNAVVSELQKIGVAFGADLNAYTSFDETVYMIQLPSDQPKYLNLGFDILYGWAAGLLFDDKEIDDERGVIMEEYRMGLGASDRMRKEWFPVLFNGSRYADRLPIGLPEIIQNFKHQVIKDFYRDWYRPDLQAVVIVGDIDVDATEKRIKELMGAIPKAQNPRTKETYTRPENKTPMAVVCTDPEAMGTTAIIYRIKPRFQLEKIGDYKTEMMHTLYNMMYDSRFSEMQQQPNCPFVQASTGYDQFIGTMDAYGSYAICKDNQMENALKVLMREDYRVLKYGFLQTELDRAKEELLNEYERAAKEVNKTESEAFAKEYVDHYLNQEPIPGVKRELTYAKKFIPEITLADVNALAKEWITEDNLVAIITAPEKEGAKAPAKEEVLNIIQDKLLANVEPYVDTYKEMDFVDAASIKAGTITNVKNLDTVDAKEYTLSNGITIVLKKTDYKNDEILFKAQSKGGLSLYDVRDIPSAVFASDLIDRAGIAEMSYSDLEKKMKGKTYGVMPSIGVLGESFSGTSAPKDLEEFMKYLHAYFTNQRIDTSVYALVISETREQMNMIHQNPQYRFFGKLMSAVNQNDPYQTTSIITMNDDFLNRINYERAVQVFKERFANPADFVFIFVGNFDDVQMDELLKKYIASLPTTDKKEKFNASVLKTFPTAQTEDVLYAGKEDQSWVGIVFEENYPQSLENDMTVNVIGEALSIELLETIREKMSGVYSPMANVGNDRYPQNHYAALVAFSCSPDNVEKLSNAVLDLLRKFQQKGPKKETLEKVKKQMINSKDNQLQTNKFWLAYINDRYFENETDKLDLINKYNDRVNAVTNTAIKQFLKNYFDVTHYLRVVLYPEAKKQ